MSTIERRQSPPPAPLPGPRLALVGSPNAGKTTVFNAFTGLRARTANYPGVTVTRTEGTARVGNRLIEIVDLPGAYGLTAVSPDEQVVADALVGAPGAEAAGAPACARHGGASRRPGDATSHDLDGIVMVVDATTLERSLLFVADVLRLGLPTLLVVTMVDELVARGGALDPARLEQALGVPVVPVVGHRGIGLDRLRSLLPEPGSWSTPVLPPPADGAARSGWVTSVLAASLITPGPDRRSARIDAVLLHPVLGGLVFLAVMLAFFQVIFTVAAPFVATLEAVFAWLADQVRSLLPGLPGEFLADGAIAGVGGVLVFLPQIALLFLMLAVLEKVGYLARAAFLADRVMGRFGLEGRSVVTMLSSFACAIPGILAARTIPNERRRLATMMAAPLMTCSARLPVYTLLVAAFVDDRAVLGPLRSRGLVMFGLYALGAVSGLVFAAVVSRVVGRGGTAPFAMELPPYRRPTLRSVLLHVWDGAWAFARKAGSIILLTSLALWLLLSVPAVTPPPGLSAAETASYEMEHSLAGRLGTAVEPVFEPLGFDWRTNVAIIGSLAAREVFVSTLALTTAADSEEALPERLQELRHPNGSLVYDRATVAAVLVFFVYALQCLATVAVLRRETNSWRWPLLATGTFLVVAYVGALAAHTVVGALA